MKVFLTIISLSFIIIGKYAIGAEARPVLLAAPLLQTGSGRGNGGGIVQKMLGLGGILQDFTETLQGFRTSQGLANLQNVARILPTLLPQMESKGVENLGFQPLQINSQERLGNGYGSLFEEGFRNLSSILISQMISQPSALGGFGSLNPNMMSQLNPHPSALGGFGNLNSNMMPQINTQTGAELELGTPGSLRNLLLKPISEILPQTEAEGSLSSKKV